MNFDFLIFPFIILNILAPTFLLAMGYLKKRWQLIFCYLVPVGFLFLTIIDGTPLLIKGIKDEFKKLI